jgi:hypothetical protein
MKPSSFNIVWKLSLISFVLAAFTGFLYRYGMHYPMPAWLNFSNIRHAHSHLMFFNWISPPIMVWFVKSLLQHGSPLPERSTSWCLYTMLFLGFLSFPFFLIYGYHSVSICSLSLPLAAIISGLVMITWYWFAWIYYKNKKTSDGLVSFSLFDAGLVALMISSLGAWGVSIFQFTDIDSPMVSSAMTHFFLSVFTEGWAVLGILGMMWHHAEKEKNDIRVSFNTGWLWLPVLFGSMLIFPFSLSQSLVTPAMHISAKLGLILIVISLSLNLWMFIRSGLFCGFIWRSVLVLLAIKIVFQLLAILPTSIWPGEHGLRVLYLHLLLLGFVSFVLFEMFLSESKKIARFLFAVTVFGVLVSLLFISGYWPPEWTPPNTYYWVMVLAFLPVVSSIWLLAESMKPVLRKV